jgi:polyisoprenoid-binding protein YceI
VRRLVKLLVGAVVVVVLVAGGMFAWYLISDRAPAKPKLSATGPSSAGGPATPNGPWHVIRRDDTYVGYRIKELFGDTIIKHEVVGRTTTVSGRLTVANGRVTAVTVSADLRDLESDRAARDTYIHDNALESARYPTGRFTLTAPIALPGRTERGKAVHTRATGRLLLHGVTRPVTVDLDARWNGPTIEVVGSAPIELVDYDIDPPDTVIAKVDDHGSIELKLVFAPGAG